MTDINEEIKSQFQNIDKKVGEALARHDSEFKSLGKASQQSSEELKSLTAQHKALADELKKMGDVVTQVEQRGQEMDAKNEAQSLGKSFVNSDSFATFKSNKSTKVREEFQNNVILTGGDNSVTPHQKVQGVVPGAFRALTVMPTIMQGTASSNIIYYSRENLHTSGAVEIAEGAAAGSATTTFEEVAETMRNISHFEEVSKQALDDSEFLMSYLDRRLAHGVNKRMESQIINGDGTGVNLKGWSAAGNSGTVAAAGTSDIFGLANKMKYSVITADYAPDYFYMNPLDWSALETQRVSSTDKRFLAASGAAITYANNGLTPLLWGLPVITSNAVAQGTIWCKSMDADMFFNRSGTMIEMYEQNKDNAEKDIVTIKASARGAHAVMTPAAVLTATIADITNPV